MKQFVIDKNADGMRLDKFMQKVMPDAKAGEIFKSLRKKKVRVNGKHKDGAFRLTEGDEVCMYINDELFGEEKQEFPWQKVCGDIDVVYEDENIIIANKPGGMPSQDTDGITDSLESRIRAYLYKKGEIDRNTSPLFVPSLCHRIDRNTSGLVIAAKNAAALRIINEKIKNREIRKFYLCETEHTPLPEKGKISGWIMKDSKTKKMIFSERYFEGGSRCETLYRTVKRGTPALVEAELLTGKTHQIRAGLAYIGCPLVGDVKYGAKKDGKRDYQHLLAYKVIFDFKTDSGKMEYLKGKKTEVNFL